MADYRNNYFEGQSIQVDGSIFRNNVFKNCQIVYGGGSLDFSGNELQNSHWHFVDDAARTVALLSSFYQQGGSSRQYVEYLMSTFGKSPEEAPSSSTDNDSESRDNESQTGSTS